MTLLELLAGESAFIILPLSSTMSIQLDPTPMLFTSPVRTALPNMMQ
jgi:hypothetical protein